MDEVMRLVLSGYNAYDLTYLMFLFVKIFAAVFIISMASNPMLEGGWSWDTANALGLAALAGLLYLSVTARGARNLVKHENFGYVVTGLISLHGLWLLFGDGAVIEYIKPDAPLYMWAGIIGLGLAFALVLLSIMPTRFNVFGGYPLFKLWHRIIAIVIVVLALYHTLAAGFYFEAWYQIAAVMLLSIWICFSRELGMSPHQATVASSKQFLVVTLLGVTIFVAVRNIA